MSIHADDYTSHSRQWRVGFRVFYPRSQ
nr:hypothetical protein [Sodalis-like endosymbiont of Proechinophthirus fluctus]